MQNSAYHPCAKKTLSDIYIYIVHTISYMSACVYIYIYYIYIYIIYIYYIYIIYIYISNERWDFPSSPIFPNVRRPSLSLLRVSAATARDPRDGDQRTARQGHPLAAPFDTGADEFQAALAQPFLQGARGAPGRFFAKLVNIEMSNARVYRRYIYYPWRIHVCMVDWF